MMQSAGTSSLQAYCCPGRHQLYQSRICSRNRRVQKPCMASFSEGAYQAEVDIPRQDEVPGEDIWKQFKNESRRSNNNIELRRRKQFEDHQDYLKRKQRQMHQNRKMQKFDRYLPRLEQSYELHDGSTFTDIFAESVDDLIGSGEFGQGAFGDFGSSDFASDFGPGPLFGMSASPFLRKVDPQEMGNKGETPIGRWGSRRTPENTAAPRTPVKNDPEQPLTARARKAAQALNAQAKQSSAAPGKHITAKNQPRQQQRQPPANNGAGKTANLPINGGSGRTGATSTPPKGQTPAPRKRWQTQRQKKTRAPGAAASDQAQARTPAPGAPVTEKQPVSV